MLPVVETLNKAALSGTDKTSFCDCSAGFLSGHCRTMVVLIHFWIKWTASRKEVLSGTED